MDLFLLSYLRPSFFTCLILLFGCLGGLTKALGKTDENSNDPSGADLAQFGLGAPPRPPLTGSTPCPTGPGLDRSEGGSFVS